MRKGTIDLDWLDWKIYEFTMAINKGVIAKEDEDEFEHVLKTLDLVRSKCTPIEEPFKSATNNSHCRVSKKYKNE